MGGAQLGDMAKISGIVSYHISPYRQRLFAGFFKNGFPNQLRNFRDFCIFVVPPGLIWYSMYSWTEAEYVRSNRKNPKDFENDV